MLRSQLMHGMPNFIRKFKWILQREPCGWTQINRGNSITNISCGFECVDRGKRGTRIDASYMWMQRKLQMIRQPHGIMKREMKTMWLRFGAARNNASAARFETRDIVAVTSCINYVSIVLVSSIRPRISRFHESKWEIQIIASLNTTFWSAGARAHRELSALMHLSV